MYFIIIYRFYHFNTTSIFFSTPLIENLKILIDTIYQARKTKLKNNIQPFCWLSKYSICYIETLNFVKFLLNASYRKASVVYNTFM